MKIANGCLCCLQHLQGCVLMPVGGVLGSMESALLGSGFCLPTYQILASKSKLSNDYFMNNEEKPEVKVA